MVCTRERRCPTVVHEVEMAWEMERWGLRGVRGAERAQTRERRGIRGV